MPRTVRIPRNVDVDTNVSIVVIPKATLTDPEAPSAAILNAAPDVTYEHTTDGASPTSSQTTVGDPRFSLRDVPQKAGPVTHAFSPTYFYGDPELELDPLLEEEAEVFYIFRDGVAIEDDFAAGQTVDIYSCTVGHAQKNRATNGKLTKTTPLFVHRKFTDVAVVA